MPISQTEDYFKISQYRFLEEPMLFLLALKWNLQEKALSSVTEKTNTNFAVKLVERSSHSFLLSIWWITFFKHLYSLIHVRSSKCVWPFSRHQALKGQVFKISQKQSCRNALQKKLMWKNHQRWIFFFKVKNCRQNQMAK